MGNGAHLSPRHAPRRRLAARALLLLPAAILAVGLMGLWPAFRAQEIDALLWIGARVQPHRLPALQRALDPWVPPQAILLVGDSFAAMLPARWIGPCTVNFGLGGSTVEQVRAQLRNLQSLGTARAIVILAGSNDLVHRSIPAAEADLRALLAALPAATPVLLCTVPPVNPDQQRLLRPAGAIASINERWSACAAARPHTRLVPVERVLADNTGRLLPDCDQGDGLHLNSTGNRRLAALLRENLGPFTP